MNYYMGLDLSLTGTGVIVLNSEGEVEYSNVLKSKFFGMKRLQYIRNTVQSVLNDCCPKEVAIEDYAMGIRTGQAFSIGELGGVIKLMLYECGYEEYRLVSPTSLKKYVTGKGVAEKDMMLLSVFKNFGYEASDNNAADAYGLAHIAYAIGENINCKHKYRQEVVANILFPDEKPKKKKEKKQTKLQRRFPQIDPDSMV